MILEIEESYIDGESELFVTLPDSICAHLNLHPGDVIEWVDRGDGSFQIKKSNA